MTVYGIKSFQTVEISRRVCVIRAFCISLLLALRLECFCYLFITVYWPTKQNKRRQLFLYLILSILEISWREKISTVVRTYILVLHMNSICPITSTLIELNWEQTFKDLIYWTTTAAVDAKGTVWLYFRPITSFIPVPLPPNTEYCTIRVNGRCELQTTVQYSTSPWSTVIMK